VPKSSSRMLACLTIVVPVQSKWILGISLQSDLRVFLVEEVFAVESLLGGSVNCCPERANASQADSNGKCNQPVSIEESREWH